MERCWCGDTNYFLINSGIWKSGEHNHRFKLVECVSCGTKRTDKFVSINYGENHQIDGKGPLSLRHRNFISTIEKYLMPGNMLEIGCGSGNLLNHFFLNHKQKIDEIKGIDINPNSVLNSENEELDLEVKLLVDEKGIYNNIVLNHCLEHIEDVKEFLLEIKKKSSLYGTNLYLCVPNIDSRWSKQDLNSFPDFSPNEHCWHFSLDTLTKLIQTVLGAKILCAKVSAIWESDEQIEVVGYTE